MKTDKRMFRYRSVLFVLLALAAAIGVVGCGDEDPGSAAVVIGAVYNLTGAQAALDVPSAQGAQLAVDETNRNGGVLGRRVQLEVADGQTNTAVVGMQTAALLQQFPSMPGLIGLSDTDMVLAAAPVTAASGRLFLTSGATSPQLPAQVGDDLFLACFGDNVQAAVGAEWAYGERSARSASILYSTSASYTVLLQGYFHTRFEQLGGQIASVQSYTPQDLSAETIAGVAPADVIYLAAQPDDALAAVQLLRAAGFTAPILGGDGLDSNLWEAHLDITDVYFTTHADVSADNPDPQVVAFRAAYQQAYPDSPPDAFAALGYDAARLLMVAIDAAGTDAPGAVRTALANTRNFPGVTGTISYSPGNPIPSKSVTILEVDRGIRRFVEQLVPAQVPPP